MNDLPKKPILWSPRGKSIQIVNKIEAEKLVKYKGFSWCFDPNVKAGVYNPAYDRGDENSLTDLPEISFNKSIEGDILHVIRL